MLILLKPSGAEHFSTRISKKKATVRIQVTGFAHRSYFSRQFLHLGLEYRLCPTLEVFIPKIYFFLAFMLSHLSRVRLFSPPWTAAHQAPLSMGFSRQKYWSGLPYSPPGYLSNPGMEPRSLTTPAMASGFLPLMPPRKPFLSMDNAFLINFALLVPLGLPLILC